MQAASNVEMPDADVAHHSNCVAATVIVSFLHLSTFRALPGAPCTKAYRSFRVQVLARAAETA